MKLCMWLSDSLCYTRDGSLSIIVLEIWHFKESCLNACRHLLLNISPIDHEPAYTPPPPPGGGGGGDFTTW